MSKYVLIYINIHIKHEVKLVDWSLQKKKVNICTINEKNDNFDIRIKIKSLK